MVINILVVHAQLFSSPPYTAVSSTGASTPLLRWWTTGKSPGTTPPLTALRLPTPASPASCMYTVLYTHTYTHTSHCFTIHVQETLLSFLLLQTVPRTIRTRGWQVLFIPVLYNCFPLLYNCLSILKITRQYKQRCGNALFKGVLVTWRN